MGISPYESPFSLWHRKAGSIADIDGTEVMYWGTQLEPVIRQEWNRRHPELAVAETGQWAHGERNWQGGSPDGLGQGRLWEAKTARFGDQWGEPGSDEIPVHYRAQVLWYLDVFGWEFCDVSVLIAGSEYREYTVRYAAAEVEHMRLKARQFLDTLEAGQPPAIDGHQATYEAVKELHPLIEAESVDLPPNIAEPYLSALVGCRDAEQEKRRCSGLVADFMGNAKDAYYAGARIASRQVKSTEGSIPYLVAAKGAADLLQKGIAA